jgi:hypothetical protein
VLNKDEKQTKQTKQKYIKEKLDIVPFSISKEGEVTIGGEVVPEGDVRSFNSGGSYHFTRDLETGQLFAVTDNGLESEDPKPRPFPLGLGHSYTLSINSCRRPDRKKEQGGESLQIGKMSSRTREVALAAVARHRGRRKRKGGK